MTDLRSLQATVTTKALSDLEYAGTQGIEIGEQRFLSSEPARYVLVDSTTSPSWLYIVYKREEQVWRIRGYLEQLLSHHQAGWDSYGALPIERRAIDQAAELVEILLEHGFPAPDVFPLTEGGARLEWMQGELELSINIDGVGEPSVYFCDDSAGEEWEARLTNSARYLNSILARLSPAHE